MNELYANYPSNLKKKISVPYVIDNNGRVVERKDPRNTFIGGLVIGLVAGGIVGYALLATLIAHSI